MVFGSDVAVVLRSRKGYGLGKNILVQTFGLNVKAVVQASHEVSAVLEGGLSQSGELIDAGLGADTHSLACGHLRVLRNRYQAVYRLVGGVLVMVFSDGHSGNVYSSLNLVLALSRLLVMECKSIEVTGERLEKRYAQVYLAVSALVTRGTLDVVHALVDSQHQLDSVTPEGVKQRRVKEAQAAAQAAAAGQERKQINRRLPEPQKGHSSFSFRAPGEWSGIVVQTPHYPMPALPEPDQPLRHKSQYADKAVPLEEPKKEEEVKPTEETPLPGPEAGFAGPLYSHKGPSLRLEEVWAAEVAGSTVVRGGLQGVVRWASQEAKVLSGSVPFKLQLADPPEGEVLPADDSALQAALKCALASDRGTRHGPEIGSFVADTLSPLPAVSPLLMYRLPAAASGPLPLLVQMSVGLIGHTKGRKEGELGVVLVSVNFTVAKELAVAPQDLVADLVVPPIFGPPRKVSPEGAKWSKSQCALRWKLGGTYPGYRGAFVAAFGVEAGLEAAAAGLSTLHALLVLKGQPGITVTGVQVAQPSGPGGPIQPQQDTSSWSACVLARPGRAIA